MTNATESGLHDVAIVGLGPVGATLAGLLAGLGLRVVVFEKEEAVYSLPRAVHFDGEVMRTFQTLGLADALEPDLAVSPGMKFVDAGERMLIDWSRPLQIGPQGWHVSYRFHQPQLEASLRERLHAWPNLVVHLDHEVVSLEPQREQVVLRLRSGASGQMHTATARYVVGCDGARSMVRTCIGAHLIDLQSHERWLVLDLLLKRPRPDLGDHSIQFCNPARPATYVRGVGNRRRWELMLMPGDDPETITRPESIWPLLSRWISPDEAQIERPAVYTFHAVVASGWRKDRLLIAGDAAHQTPPFMGQGMCAGIRDVFNLAWKLADVVRQHAPAQLLDSYESERAPHARQFIETAVRLGKVIQATDPAAVKQRDEQMASDPQIFRTPEPPLGPGWHRGGQWGGRLSTQPVLADGRRLDDRVGYRWCVIATSALAATLQAGERLAVLAADQPALQDWLRQYRAAAVLLRPDKYIAGTADDAPALRALIKNLVA